MATPLCSECGSPGKLVKVLGKNNAVCFICNHDPSHNEVYIIYNDQTVKE